MTEESGVTSSPSSSSSSCCNDLPTSTTSSPNPESQSQNSIMIQVQQPKPEKMKHLTLFNKKLIELPESQVKSLFYGALSGIVVTNILFMPFLLPKYGKFLGAPYLPTRRKTVDLLFSERLLGGYKKSINTVQKTVLLDVGSGDGRVCFAAAKNGYKSIGIELNPYLYWYSLFKRQILLNKEERQRCTIKLGNVWHQKDLTEKIDIVTVYGRPGDNLMEKLAREVFEPRLRKDCLVASNQFEIPGWEKMLVRDIEGVKLYDRGLG